MTDEGRKHVRRDDSENFRAESSRMLVRDGAKPVAWINADTLEPEINSTADALEVRLGLLAAMCYWRDEREQRARAAPLSRERKLKFDPYQCRDQSFADIVEDESPTLDESDAIAISGSMDTVRRRILDDVEGTHRMLDDLGIPGGTLSARLGIALVRASAAAAPVEDDRPITEREIAREFQRIESRRRAVARRAGTDRDPVPDGVRVPEAHKLIATLEGMPGEDVFRIFDRLKLVPADRDIVERWNFTDPASVAEMIGVCCAVALEADKLGELARAVFPGLDAAVDLTEGA